MFRWSVWSLVVVMLVAGTAGPAAAAPEKLAGLDELIHEFVTDAMGEEDVPGAAVTVVSAEEELYREGFGTADLDADVPVDPDETLFLIGSQAKLLTAQAALQLVDAGRLDLDTDVNEYLEDFKIDDTYPGRPVTLRHLLTHTAGFDEDYQVGLGGDTPDDYGDLGERLAETQPERIRPPGEAITYNNYALGLAGYLVEIASGQSYGDYVREHVFAPLGLNSSTADTPRPDELNDRLATSYGAGLDEIDLTYGDYAPTGVGPAMTPSDMSVYMRAQLARDPELGPGVAEQMQTRQYAEDDDLPGVGFVFEESEYNGYTTLFKGGDMPGTHSFMFLIPDLGIGFNLVSNGDGAEGHGVDGFALRDRIIDEYLPALTAPHARPLDGADSSRYEGWYLNSRVGHNGFTKIRALLSEEPVHVVSEKDGGITTDGFMDDAHWTQVEPGEFVIDDGWERLVFRDDGGFAVTNSAVVFDRIGWVENSRLHLGVLMFGIIVLVVALFWLPVMAGVRRLRGRPRHPAPARLARLVAWLTAALTAGFLAGAVNLGADKAALTPAVWSGSPALIIPLWLAALTVPFAVGVLACGVVAWRRGWWRMPGRISYSVIAVGGLAFAAFAVTYNMVPPFT